MPNFRNVNPRRDLDTNNKAQYALARHDIADRVNEENGKYFTQDSPIIPISSFDRLGDAFNLIYLDKKLEAIRDTLPERDIRLFNSMDSSRTGKIPLRRK